ncbi:PP2C family protein-serine/threonine phosphatase [Streptomyces sp. NRRL B-3648]|uniref:PP2C family protein-serine/threonine phosphatase n=1 Tax=Streptomyces sp. NRRL B-3648 TaxID=1519493 RepID=UPI00099BC8F2|nr:PP2C family protein-serine/threonine phosphatase [Streptomyces sp. NRRL B-3648]
MSQPRHHAGDHPPTRLSGNRAAGAWGSVRRRASGQLAAGMPALPVLVVAVVVLVDVAGGAGMVWLPLLAAGPALAATTNGPLGVLGAGLLAAATGTALGTMHGTAPRDLAAVLCALLAVTAASGLASVLRGRRERVLAAVRSVAEAAQQALLQPVPETVGPYRVAVRYSAAAAEARIGGDLYALVPTPYGIRLIVGDVRGKGLPAVGTAALVLGVFREAAHDEPDLLAVVGRIERSLARNLGPDDFVTAVVAGCPASGHLEVVNCGHAPPLLISASGEVEALEADRPAPPLGLRALSGQAPRLQRLPFEVGGQLLLYTDGVTEARDHTRTFYPLADGVARHVGDEPARTLTALHDELLAHVGGRLHDDAALLLLRKEARETKETKGTKETAEVREETAREPVSGPREPSVPDTVLRTATGSPQPATSSAQRVTPPGWIRMP